MNLSTRLTSQLRVLAVPGLTDNYFWLIHDIDGNAIAVDPGAALPIEAALTHRQLKLRAILITHHHSDHIGGVPALQERRQIPVYAPQDIRISWANEHVKEGDEIALKQPSIKFSVWHIPGHTHSHHAFIGNNAAFVGDTLFSAGCGRIFEGTPAQMLDSLERLAQLTPETLVFCGHEYTLDNARFALQWEPENLALQQHYAQAKARACGESTLPTTIRCEREINPFLRCSEAGLIARLSSHMGKSLTSPLEVFTALRFLKNQHVPTSAVE